MLQNSEVKRMKELYALIRQAMVIAGDQELEVEHRLNFLHAVGRKAELVGMLLQNKKEAKK